MDDDKQIDFMFKYLNEHAFDSGLSEAQINLVVSFQNQWDKEYFLSRKQIEILTDIFQKCQ